MDNKNGSATGGIGFCGLLAIVFIVIKLTNVITWSWIWILAPIWIPFVVFFVLVILFAFISVKEENND